MLTRGSASYQPNQSDPILELIQSLKDEMTASLTNINLRLDHLENHQIQTRGTPEVNSIPPPQAYVHRDPNPEDRILRNVRLEAPSIDGNLDPIKFLDWLTEIEDYCEWHKLEDDRRVGLARMKLQGQARNYWRNQEHIFRQRPGHRTATWEEMKEKLKAKYLPLSHRLRMLDEWQRLTQGSKSVMESSTNLTNICVGVKFKRMKS